MAEPGCPDTSPYDADSLGPGLDSVRQIQDRALATLGLYRFKIPEDANCLFRAVAAELRLDQNKYHTVLRQATVTWLRHNAGQLLADGLLGSVHEIDDTAHEGAWPSLASLVALCNVLNVNIAVVQGSDHIDIQHVTPADGASGVEPGGIILAYVDTGHYDAVVHEANLPNPDYNLWMKDRIERQRQARTSSAYDVKQSSDVTGDVVIGNQQQAADSAVTSVPKRSELYLNLNQPVQVEEKSGVAYYQIEEPSTPTTMPAMAFVRPVIQTPPAFSTNAEALIRDVLEAPKIPFEQTPMLDNLQYPTSPDSSSPLEKHPAHKINVASQGEGRRPDEESATSPTSKVHILPIRVQSQQPAPPARSDPITCHKLVTSHVQATPSGQTVPIYQSQGIKIGLKTPKNVGGAKPKKIVISFQRRPVQKITPSQSLGLTPSQPLDLTPCQPLDLTPCQPLNLTPCQPPVKSPVSTQPLRSLPIHRESITIKQPHPITISPEHSRTIPIHTEFAHSPAGATVPTISRVLSRDDLLDVTDFLRSFKSRFDIGDLDRMLKDMSI